mmetsp:Transcript_9715/g.15903  ORF Transcript_9715/g.15903 Transcript_9715/m.15903 type:complete len:701 (+) Transcript_9715:298-2400(+)|eukprot:CAMPEP_0184673688 /NCGR_PEP_ID=MMETSP0308-20130426/86817_1 /TAXON_ID=38269 /ORGANISM="Gloeochaete witrockiana, Strain SAG 46.84" /LENGTH=700 /DNA_ID=CAMNT_0027121203 /DNA_START=187 /DNA_END=2289 /DNA_ORIENTATION=-
MSSADENGLAPENLSDLSEGQDIAESSSSMISGKFEPLRETETIRDDEGDEQYHEDQGRAGEDPLNLSGNEQYLDPVDAELAAEAAEIEAEEARLAAEEAALMAEEERLSLEHSQGSEIEAEIEVEAKQEMVAYAEPMAHDDGNEIHDVPVALEEASPLIISAAAYEEQPMEFPRDNIEAEPAAVEPLPAEPIEAESIEAESVEAESVVVQSDYVISSEPEQEHAPFEADLSFVEQQEQEEPTVPIEADLDCSISYDDVDPALPIIEAKKPEFSILEEVKSAPVHNAISESELAVVVEELERSPIESMPITYSVPLPETVSEMLSSAPIAYVEQQQQQQQSSSSIEQEQNDVLPPYTISEPFSEEYEDASPRKHHHHRDEQEQEFSPMPSMSPRTQPTTPTANTNAASRSRRGSQQSTSSRRPSTAGPVLLDKVYDLDHIYTLSKAKTGMAFDKQAERSLFKEEIAHSNINLGPGCYTPEDGIAARASKDKNHMSAAFKDHTPRAALVSTRTSLDLGPGCYAKEVKVEKSTKSSPAFKDSSARPANMVKNSTTPDLGPGAYNIMPTTARQERRPSATFLDQTPRQPWREDKFQLGPGSYQYENPTDISHRIKDNHAATACFKDNTPRSSLVNKACPPELGPGVYDLKDSKKSPSAVVDMKKGADRFATTSQMYVPDTPRRMAKATQLRKSDSNHCLSVCA